MKFRDSLHATQIFVEVARTLSVTQAAQTLGMTKSSVSKAVTQLEQRLGVKLIHRTTRKLTLTDDGVAYFEICKRSLEEIETAEAYLSKDASAIAGRISIDAPAAWGRAVLLPILADIARDNPELSLSLRFNDRIIDPVAERIDLALRFGETPDTSGLVMRKLTQQRACIVASPDYIARRGSPAVVEDLNNHDCITGIKADAPQGFRVLSSGGAIRMTVSPKHEIGDGAAVVAAAIAGMGIAQMPHSLVSGALQQGFLVELLTEASAPPIGVYAVWPQTQHLHARVRHIVDILADYGKRGLL